MQQLKENKKLRFKDTAPLSGRIPVALKRQVLSKLASQGRTVADWLTEVSTKYVAGK